MATVIIPDALKGKKFGELQEMLTTKTTETKSFYDSKKNAKGEVDMTVAEFEEFKSRQAELNDIGAALDLAAEQRKVEDEFKNTQERLGAPIRPQFAATNNSREIEGKAELSMGERFVQSEAYRSMIKTGGKKEAEANFEDHEFKTTMVTSAGFAPANNRTNIVVPTGTTRIVLQDLIPSVTTDLDAIKFMEETNFTNNTAGTSENAALPESAIAYTERTQSVELIGTFLPVTEQQLEIAEGVRSIIDQRLMTMYLLKEQSDLLLGNGSSPNIQGFINKAGIQTQAKGADNAPDAIYKLFTKLRGGAGSGFVEPSAIVLHPNDWQDIRLLTDLNGQYLWGSPSEAGVERIWGKPVVQTHSISENTGLAGDFAMYSQIWRKRGVRVDVGMQNDDFVKNKLTIKITARLALVIYRASAFGTVTSI